MLEGVSFGRGSAFEGGVACVLPVAGAVPVDQASLLELREDLRVGVRVRVRVRVRAWVRVRVRVRVSVVLA